MKTANGRLAGKTTWQVTVWLDHNDDPFYDSLGSAEYSNLGLTKAWVNRNLPLLSANDKRPGIAWARVERGIYEESSFEDDEFGLVIDADWERDHGTLQWLAFLDDNGIDVTWSEG